VKTVDNFLYTAAEYEQSLRDYAKFNPIRSGAFVATYENADQSRFIAYGEIISAHWDEGVTAYKYEIQVCQSAAVIKAWSFHCREVDASEIRPLITAVRS
jgi:hypothetical protein